MVPRTTTEAREYRKAFGCRQPEETPLLIPRQPPFTYADPATAIAIAHSDKDLVLFNQTAERTIQIELANPYPK